MKPAAFDYVAPTALDEVVDLLSRHGDEAKVLAGGQSLVPLMALRLVTPGVLIDLNRVEELDYLRLQDHTLVVGALARHRAVEDAAKIRGRCPMVAEAVGSIGHVAIRNRGTVVGSLAHADPAAEWPALALALDAELEAVGPNGSRSIPASEFFVTYFTTALAHDEVLKEVRFRLPPGRSGSAFVELARRHGDFAIAGAGAVLELGEDGLVQDARIVLMGVKDTAVRARVAETLLVGRRPVEETLVEASASVGDEIDPLSDLHASSDYRRHVARVLVRRALSTAWRRAGGSGFATKRGTG